MSDDPWLWTVDELVSRLCHSKDIFQAAGCKNADIPGTMALEKQLRGEQVTGALFLNALQPPLIQDSLAVYNVEQRLALTTVIDFLQRQSLTYKQNKATTGVQSFNLSSKERTSTMSSTLASDAVDYIDPNGRKRQKLIHVDTVPVSSMPQHPQHFVSEAGEWDYLLRWQHVDNSEGISDLGEEEESELEEDSGEDKSPKNCKVICALEEPSQFQLKMSPEQVIEIINERIEHYTNSWNIGKEKDHTYDPVAMWNKADTSNQREKLVQVHEKEVEYYRQRLDKLCDEIVRGYTTSGGNITTVRLQCRNLEVTIESMELARWQRDVYQRLSVRESEEESISSCSIQAEIVGGVSPSIPSSHRPQASTEVIDLGSPSETSNDLDDTVLIGASQGRELHASERPSIPSRTAEMEDLNIADTIEPLSHTQPEVRTHVKFKDPSIIGATPSATLPIVHGDEPEHSSIGTVDSWKWKYLIATQDRKRIVSKAVLELKSDDREMIRTRLNIVGKAIMMKEIQACITMLVARKTRMQGVLPRDLAKIMVFTRLFLCWWMCYRHLTGEVSAWRLKELSKWLEEGQSPDLGVFCEYLAVVMSTTFSVEALKHPDRPSKKEIISLISDDEDEVPSQSTPHHRHKENKKINSQHNSYIVLD